MLTLSKRLQRIVDLISGSVLADIGCDHGYVCVKAIQSGKVKKAYACDIATKPLENAKSTIEKEKVQNISCIQMNGIEKLPKDVDTIVIAGMGGSLICEILNTSFALIHTGTQLILSPQKDVEDFRMFLAKTGFEIKEECVLYEDKHYYHIFDTIYTAQSYILDDAQILYGCHVIQNEEYKDYLHYEINKWSKIYEQLPDYKKEAILKRIQILKEISA